MKSSDAFPRFRLIAQICASLTLGIGTVALGGWIFDIPHWRSFIPGWVEMKGNTAVGFIAAGLALLCLATDQAHRLRRNCGYFLAWALLLLGAATLAQFIFRIDLGIDQMFFSEAAGTVGTTSPNRMAPAIALNFILNGLALLLIDWEFKKEHRPGQYLSLFGAIFPLQALVAYSYGVKNVLGTGVYVLITQMSVPAACGWLALSIGTLLARPNQGLLRPFTFDVDLSRCWGRTLIMSVFLPPAFGFLFSVGAREGWYDPGFGYSLLAVTCVLSMTGFVWSSATRTWRIRLEQIETESRIRAALELRDEFLSIASHELKTPLTTLKLQAQGIKRLCRQGIQSPGFSEAALCNYAMRTDSQVDRLNHLVEDMLDATRIEAGALQTHLQDVDLSQLAQDVCQLFRTQLPADKNILSLDIESGIQCRCDPNRIEQVLENLLSNSIKYGLGKPVDVSLQRRAGSVCLQVHDNGDGIAAQDQERIFERFERAISCSEVSGLGLGLYIVRKIVDEHRGTIRVESQKGVGSTFSVVLPLNNPDSVYIPASPA